MDTEDDTYEAEEMISVIVPVYNTGKFLDKCIDSLLEQSYVDYEILIVDDGSTDGSNEICDRQTSKAHSIQVFHKENGGLSSARNYGMDRAIGEYVIFPDPDDWVEPDYLKKLLSIREQYNVDLSICGHYNSYDYQGDIWWNSQAKPVVLQQADALELLMRPNSFCGYAWNKLYCLDVIRQNHLRFDEELGMVQDLPFALRYFLCCQTVAYDPIPLYHHSRSSGGVTSFSPLSPKKLSSITAYKRIASMMRETHPQIAAIAYSSLCKTCAKFIAMYYHFHTHDKHALCMLKENFSIYKDYFFSSDAYSDYEKRYTNIIPFSPWLYYQIYRTRYSYNVMIASLRKRNEKKRVPDN